MRDAVPRDAEQCAALYAPYVTDTAGTFETDVPAPAEFARRIETAQRAHAWLVLEDAGRVVGYAYGCPYKPRAAYRWSCEVSVYLETGRRRTGGGAHCTRRCSRGWRPAATGRRWRA